MDCAKFCILYFENCEVAFFFLARAALNYYMLLFGGGAGSFVGFVPFAWVGCECLNSVT